ncbi:hypothetical protein GCM10010441_06850 [Kitasatospora paracochleata]|uniref:Uncharacterized protein n=2 Tax=Kitasatospora TaxID=2063 RepID=A0ABT1J7H3_9ACTN|nr:hypothetical protein [Kitasatospora paracochleata]MCP2313388.1 hypothetical protein [Kitasatospora paracochleata]
MKDFRSELSDELTALNPPPLGDIVGSAMRSGRRTRRGRAIGAVTGSVVALTGIAVLLGGPLGVAGRTPNQVGVAAATASSPVALAAGANPTPTAGLVPTTGAALLSSLLRVLPQDAQTSGYAGETAWVAGSNETVAQVYLTTPAGTGMIRVFLGSANPAMPCSAENSCVRDQRGQQVRVIHHKDNCIQNTVVSVLHADGTEVMLDMASCLAWDGKGNKPGILALTEEQAIAVAGDPAIGKLMTQAAGEAAAAQFPSLPRLTS